MHFFVVLCISLKGQTAQIFLHTFVQNTYTGDIYETLYRIKQMGNYFRRSHIRRIHRICNSGNDNFSDIMTRGTESRRAFRSFC